MVFIIVCFLLSAAPAVLTDTSVSDTNGVNYRFHDINYVKMWISNHGKLCQTMQGQTGCWWPKNTNHNYIFGAGFWLGAVDYLTGDTLVTIGYGPHGGETEFAPGLSGQDPRDGNNAIYLYPARWPPPPSAFPMTPIKAMSNQDSWCCYNDCDTARHMAGDTRPIGIEVYQTIYAWKYAIVQDALYLIFELRNVSGRTLRKLLFGFCTDLNIGVMDDEMVSAIPRRWYRYANGDSALADDLGYAWQESDEFGWDPPVPGAMGVDLIQTPFDLVPGRDRDSDGIPDQHERDSLYYCQNIPPSQWDKDSDQIPDWRDASQNPQIGMTAFKRFTLNLEPNKDNERYLTMAGYNFKTGAYEPFDTLPLAPDDMRFITSCGPFNLMPDSSTVIVVGIMFTYWHDQYGSPDSALVLQDHWVQAVWDELYFESGVSRLPKPVTNDSNLLVVAPNPVLEYANITYTIREDGYYSLKLFNLVGQSIMDVFQGSRTCGVYNVTLDARDLPQGSYFLVLKNGAAETAKSVVVVK